MDLDMMKLCWRNEARVESHGPLDRAAVSEWIRREATDVRRRMRRRLRREIGYYAPTVAVLALTWLGGHGTSAGMLFSAIFAAAFAAMLSALWRSQRRIDGAALDGSLRDVLKQLLQDIERASRLYLASFVALFACGALLVAALFWQESGIDRRLGITVAVGTLAVAFSYWSGRAYVRRMFGPQRSTLIQCLRELDGTS
jgi:hypothetical protein